jgi:hypothetical protein
VMPGLMSPKDGKLISFPLHVRPTAVNIYILE